jgi:hypothetical protein
VGISFKRGPATVRITAPFGREKTEFSLAESVPPEAIPLEDKPSRGWEIKSLASTLEGLGYRASLLRLDTIPDLGDEPAIDLIDRFLGNVRLLTGQWWIGRDRNPFSSPIRNRFGIAADWTRVGAAQVYSGAYGLWGFERALNETDLQSLANQMNRGKTIPVSDDLFFQGVHAHARHDVRASIINLAIAAEAGVAEKLERIGRERGLDFKRIKQVLGREFLQRLDNGTRDIMGRSFKTERAAEYSWIKSLWASRGHLAHGKAARVPLPDGSIGGIGLPELSKIIPAVAVLLRWV